MKWRVFAAAALMAASVWGAAGNAFADERDRATPRGPTLKLGDGPTWDLGSIISGAGALFGSLGEIAMKPIEGQLANLRSELNLTERQMPAWDEFNDVIIAAAQHRNERVKQAWGNRSGERSSSIMGRLDAQEAAASDELEHIRQIRRAYGRLFNALAPEQKRTAETLSLPLLSMLGVIAPDPVALMGARPPGLPPGLPPLPPGFPPLPGMGRLPQ